MRSQGPPGIARYLAKVDSARAVLPPPLIRVLRDEDGYEREESWYPREERWDFSHHLLDDRSGVDDHHDFVEIGEDRVAELQAAWRVRLAAEPRT